jgi:hypothetical protein
MTRTYLVVDNNELHKMLIEGNFTERFTFTARRSRRTTSLGLGLRYKSRQLDFPAMLLCQGQVKLGVVPFDMRAERRIRRLQGIFPLLLFTGRQCLPMQRLAESKPTEM